MKKNIILLLAFSFLLNSCSILSKIYVRNYYEHEVTVLVENLWIKEKAKTSTKSWARYTPEIVNINAKTPNKLTDSLSMDYDANGTLGIKIPARSTVLLEVMGNAAPSKEIKISVFGTPPTKEYRKLANYTVNDVVYRRFHTYCLDIKPD